MSSLRWVLIGSLCLAFCSACAKSKGPQAGTNTNWLKSCNATADCNDDGDCLCGVCTLSCTNDAPCSGVGSGTSCAQLTEATCGASATGSACLPECERDDDCAAITGSVCREGHCVPTLAPSTDGSVDAGGREDGGIEDGGVVTCTAANMRPVLGTCIVSTAIESLDPGPGIPHVGLDLVGTVVEQGIGEPPENCFSAFDNVLGQGFFDGSPELDDARWIRLEDATGQRVLIGVIGPGFEWPLQMDAMASIAYERADGGFSPVRGRLELRSEDGSLVAWFGLAGSVPELQSPPELTLSQGPEFCRANSQCIDFTMHDLVVHLNNEPKPVPLSYGKQAVLGGFTLTHGGVDQQVGASTCLDAFVAWAMAGAWRNR